MEGGLWTACRNTCKFYKIRYSMVLGAIPLVVWMAKPSAPPAEAALEARPVATEGIRSVPLDTRTFNARWQPVYHLPPAALVARIDVPQTVGATESARPRSRPEPGVVPRAPPPDRRVKRAMLRPDICARHGMRRVEYLKRGYKHWRCRR